MVSRNVQTAIVLQGGGALGAYEFGVLKALYEQRPGFRPVAVAGISIGAITPPCSEAARVIRSTRSTPSGGAKLTVAPPIPSRWLPAAVDRSLATLGNPGMYQLQTQLFASPWLLTSIYDTTPLRQTLAELVDPRDSTTTPPG